MVLALESEAALCFLSDTRYFSPAPRWGAGWLGSTCHRVDVAVLGSQDDFPFLCSLNLSRCWNPSLVSLRGFGILRTGWLANPEG